MHKKEEEEELTQKVKAEARKAAVFKLMQMNLSTNSDGLLRYQQVLFATIREAYSDLLFENLTDKGVRKITKKES